VDELRPLINFYVSAIWKRRWSVVIVAWLACLAGWFAVAMIPNQYTATAKLYVDTDSVIDPLMRGLAVTPDIDRQIEVMRQTLLSRPNVEQIIRRVDLDLTLEDGASPRQMEALVERLVDQITVRAEARNLYQVSFTSSDPKQAYFVVDAVLEIFVEQNVGVTQRDVDSARGFIDRQIAEYESKLRDAELAVAKFKRENAAELGGVERSQRQLEAAEVRLRSLNSDRDSAVWNRDQLKAQLATIPRTLPASQVAGGPTLQEARLANLIQTRARLLLIYTERHPDILSLDTQITQAEADLEAANGIGSGNGGGRVPNPIFSQIEQQYLSTEARIRDLERQIDLVREQIEEFSLGVAQTPQVEADLTRLTRDYEVLFTNYQELIQRRESAQFAQRLDSETDRIEFRVVEPPFVPSAPSGPPHGLMMAAVLFGGIGAGLALAFVRVMLDETVQTVNQLKERFDLPVLGAVSQVRSTFSRQVRRLEIASLCGLASALLVSFAGVFYLYQLQPEKPDLATLAGEMRVSLSERLGVEI